MGLEFYDTDALRNDPERVDSDSECRLRYLKKDVITHND